MDFAQLPSFCLKQLREPSWQSLLRLRKQAFILESAQCWKNNFTHAHKRLTSQSLSLAAQLGQPGGRFCTTVWVGGGIRMLVRATPPSGSDVTGTMSTTWVPAALVVVLSPTLSTASSPSANKTMVLKRDTYNRMTDTKYTAKFFRQSHTPR